MTKFQQAADAARVLAAQFSGLQVIAEALVDIGSVEQAAEEAKARHQAAIREEQQFQEARDAEFKNHQSLVSAAQQQVREATAEAERLTGDAAKRADSVLHAAHADAERITQEAQVAVEALQAKAGAEIDAQRTQADTELAAVNARIAAAKEHIAKLTSI